MSTSSTLSSNQIASLRGVGKTYRMTGRDLDVLSGVDFIIERGEFLALMGPSGAGKSTLLNIIGLLDTPTTGTYEFVGEDTSRFSDARLSRTRNLEIGFVFQSFNLFPRLTVQGNIEVPMIYAEYSRLGRRLRAKELAERVGLADRLGHYTTQLSGGEMQRVAIARSLACEPALVLADEPTGNLDERTGEEIMDLLANLNSEGITIVMVTHNPALLAHARRVIDIHDGRVREDRLL